MALTSLPISVEFNFNELEQEISREVAQYVRRKLFSMQVQLRREIIPIVQFEFRNSPEYRELLPGGNLYHEFGVLDSVSILDNILETLLFDIDVLVESNALVVRVFSGEYGRLLSTPGARFLSEDNRPVPWLEWLLFYKGDTALYNFSYVPKFSRNSRTGFGIMWIEKDVRLSGKQFGIKKVGYSPNQQYAGDENDNWIIRVMKKVEPKVESLILEFIDRPIF